MHLEPVHVWLSEAWHVPDPQQPPRMLQDLKDQFREVGVVVYANVVKDDTGRSKGWGIVEFETPEEVSAAAAA